MTDNLYRKKHSEIRKTMNKQVKLIKFVIF